MRLAGRFKLRVSAGRVSVVLAAMGLFAALGGVSEAVQLIDGHSIKRGSIPLTALERKAIKSLRGHAGPRGLRGSACLPSNPACVGPPGPERTNPAPTAVVTVIGTGSQFTCDGGSLAGTFCQFGSTGLGFANYANGYAGAAFWRDIGGDVHISGVVKEVGPNACGNPGVVPAIFYLPVGYRPAAAHAFATQASGALSQISVHPNGAVTCDSGDATTDVLLDGIEFQAGH